MQKELEWLEKQPSSQVTNKNLRETKEKLNCWLDKENAMWKQRARLNWFQGGDRNTGFFHAKASSRFKKNMIEGVCDANGVWREEGDFIEMVFVDYYAELVKSLNPSDFSEVVEAVQPKVSESMNARLTRDFQAKEVHRALKQMYSLKAPGPDGMPPLFFQHFWPVVGGMVTKTVLGFLNSRIIPPKFNDTHIVLIPKSKNPRNVTKYRPISLCNMVYKLASKTLVNRLKKFLPSIISESQSAFVNGRLITDNVLVAIETMHHINQKKGGAKGEMALKLDMSKAYDRVEWRCLDKIMEKLGFNSRWRNLMLQCISTVTYSIKINGKQCGQISPTHDLRQGDPLSPFLFLFCAEGLSAMIKKAVDREKMEGISICRGGPRISHIFFADDSIVFYKASTEECDALQRILGVYENSSGQQLNRSKTSLFFSPNTSESTKHEIKNRFEAQVIKQHEKYLGLPSLIGRSKKKSFREIKEKLAGWKEKLLTKAGKEVLIKAVAQAIPTYAMSCFKIPNSLYDEMTSLIKNLW